MPTGQLEQAEAVLDTAAFKHCRAGENLLVDVNGHGILAPLELLWERRIQIRDMDVIQRAETTNGAPTFLKS